MAPFCTAYFNWNIKLKFWISGSSRLVYTRPNYTSGQADVPTRTEECICVRSKNRHEVDPYERLASWLWRARATVPTTRICYITCYITRSARLVYMRLSTLNQVHTLTSYSISIILPSRSRGGSVGVVTGYGLDVQGIGVRFPGETKRFLLYSFSAHTGSGVHPAFCTMGTGGSFPLVKR
jgi:hypothetical protein